MPPRKFLPPPKEEPVIPFTKAAYQQLEENFARLTEERKEVMIRLQTAREMGDLSENGAYIYAKFELGSISRQLSQLKHLLKNGQVIEKTQKELVEFGSEVTLVSQGKETSYTIVSLHESNLAEHKLSLESPLGSAILGKKMGDKVVVVTPKGEVEYLIQQIS